MPSGRSMINMKKCVLAAGLLGAVLSPGIAAAALGEPEARWKPTSRGCRPRSRSILAPAIESMNWCYPPARGCASSSERTAKYSRWPGTAPPSRICGRL
jgi:hypothetical protein